MARPRRYTAAEVIDALEATGGVVVRAAKMLGCAPKTVYAYADRYVTVREAMEEARKDTYAEAQGYLLAMMRDREHKDHKWAVERILKTYGDGIADGLEWSDKERIEHSGPGGTDAIKIIRVNEAPEPDNRTDDDD